ncbi:MAG TPA: T9SS type A sorting domain-containing protein, partial [Bacteroidetes bacterium]|nr:T9SS type A sorting domain-containing protein [Bacteroidota bacterium]
VGDVNECEQTQTVSVAQFGCPEMIIEDQIVNVLCYDNCDGSISITGVTNTQGTLSYNWSNGSTNSSITNLCPGNYSVTITDISLNCSTNKSYTITQPSKLSVTTAKIDESCNGCNNGTATATATGGIPPYNYNWSNGATSQTISNLTPGTYTITVEDANQCTALDTIIIDQYGCPDMVIQDSIEEISCYGTCDGSISINGISNTIGTLLYQWSNNASNSSISNLCPGNYSVTVTDVSNNCTVSKSYTLIQPDDIIITIDNKINPTSNSKGKIDISTNNDGTYTFTWTGPNGYNTNTEDIDSLEEGCYSLIVANDNDCSKDTTICLEKETATFDLNNNFVVSLYPNPASNQIIVDISKTGFTNTEISIFNISGDRYNFYKSENSKLVILDVSKLKQGLYFVEIKFETGIVFKKLVISK